MANKISVIMPSYLGHYDGCAAERELKLMRAVHSFLDNTYENKELIIISDGCTRTTDIYNMFFIHYDNIKLVKIEKQSLFSGSVRQRGIDECSGEIITFLDIDDLIGIDHLSKIVYYMNAMRLDWCYYDANLGYGKNNFGISETILVGGNCGTSSISYRKEMGVSWDKCDGGGHDWNFIIWLMRSSKNYKKIDEIKSYHICHINGKFDV